MPKLYNVQQNIGKARYVVNHHDGVKTHGDGSAFYDISIFSNKRELGRRIKDLERHGYVPSSMYSPEPSGTPDPEDDPPAPDPAKIIAYARERYANHSDNDVEIDDDPALSEADDGTWVAAWVWVNHEDCVSF